MVLLPLIENKFRFNYRKEDSSKFLLRFFFNPKEKKIFPLEEEERRQTFDFQTPSETVFLRCGSGEEALFWEDADPEPKERNKSC